MADYIIVMVMVLGGFALGWAGFKSIVREERELAQARAMIRNTPNPKLVRVLNSEDPRDLQTAATRGTCNECGGPNDGTHGIVCSECYYTMNC